MKKVSSLICAIFACLIVASNAYAMDIRIDFTDPTATVGEEVTVTMKIKSQDSGTLGSAVVLLSYDTNYLDYKSGTDASGGAGTIRATSSSSSDNKVWEYTFTFTALKAGTSSIQITSQEVYDANGAMANMIHQGNSSITISAAAGSSTNAELSSLRISPGTLSPQFSKDVTEYTAHVGLATDKLTISATTIGENSTVLISGNENLVEGENVVTCIVTAQDGTTTKTYTINVNKSVDGEDDEQVTDAVTSNRSVTVEDKQMTVAADFSDEIIPEGFVASTFTYKGETIKAITNDAGSMTLVYLYDDSAEGSFYFYDETNDTFTAYIIINTNIKSVTMLPLPDDVSVPAGLLQTTISLNSHKNTTVWVLNDGDQADHFIIYGMNSNGETGFYRYDAAEKTIQRYFDDGYGQVLADRDSAIEMYNTLSGRYRVAVIIIIIMVILLLGVGGFAIYYVMNHKNRYRDDTMDYDGIEIVDLERSTRNTHRRSRRRNR